VIPIFGEREKEFNMSAFAKQTSIAKALTLGIALSMTLSLPAFSNPSSRAIPGPAIQRQGVNSFEPGDLVRLRSAGPAMTVDSIKGNQVDCFWTGVDDEVNAESFSIGVLQKF
jgi:uncharacterized protein YodC (DUF2158 family)